MLRAHRSATCLANEQGLPRVPAGHGSGHPPGARHSSGMEQVSWPRIEEAKVIEDGQAIGVLLREFDGTISAIRIPVEQLAD